MKRIPAKPAALSLLSAMVLLQAVVAGADEERLADIRFQAASSDAVWVGQEVELQLEMWTDGFSFGKQLFIPPEVRGGYLLQADSSTVKLNEQRGGEQWQGLRYTLLFYPQRAGRLTVPPFEVSFTASAGFGTKPTAFTFQTPEIPIEARLPPGAEAGALLVTSTGFTMEYSWEPPLPTPGPGEVQVGDAVRLEVRRTATGVPGMVFAPLPEIRIEGLRAYPEAARVNDRINRGELTGNRSDALTFICEREGSYTIPELRFQWWDPEQEQMSEEIIPARELEVVANPAFASGGTAAPGRLNDFLSWKSVLGLVALAVLLVFFGPSAWRRFIEFMKQARIDRVSGEAWAFRQVRKSCLSGAPVDAYNAINLWLSRLEGRRAGLSLTQFAMDSGDEELARQAISLQENLVSGLSREWSGRKLAQLLVKARKNAGQPIERNHDLRPLNPGAVKSP